MQTQHRIKKIMKETQNQLKYEEKMRKKVLKEIETSHAVDEEKDYKNNLQVYQRKQSHYRIHQNIGKVRAVAQALTLTSQFHHHKHLSNIRMNGHYVNDDEFENLEKYFSNSLSSISENVRGEVTLPYAPVFLEKLKEKKGNIFSTYRAPSDSYYKKKGRFKTNEEVEEELLKYSFEPAVEYKLKLKKATSNLWHEPADDNNSINKIKQSVTMPPKKTSPNIISPKDRKQRFKLNMSPLKKHRILKYNTASFMNMDKFIPRR